MNEPIELIEKDLKYKKEELGGLQKRLDNENKAAISTTAAIQVLKKKIGVSEKAVALLKGGDKKDGK